MYFDYLFLWSYFKITSYYIFPCNSHVLNCGFQITVIVSLRYEGIINLNPYNRSYLYNYTSSPNIFLFFDSNVFLQIWHFLHLKSFMFMIYEKLNALIITCISRIIICTKPRIWKIFQRYQKSKSKLYNNMVELILH